MLPKGRILLFHLFPLGILCALESTPVASTGHLSPLSFPFPPSVTDNICDLDAVQGGPFTINNINLLGRPTKTPAAVFVDLIFGSLAQTTGPKVTATRNMRTSSAAIAMKWPKPIFKAIPRGTIEWK
jgi:hypothetical protein